MIAPCVRDRKGFDELNKRKLERRQVLLGQCVAIVPGLAANVRAFRHAPMMRARVAQRKSFDSMIVESEIVAKQKI